MIVLKGSGIVNVSYVEVDEPHAAIRLDHDVPWFDILVSDFCLPPDEQLRLEDILQNLQAELLWWKQRIIHLPPILILGAGNDVIQTLALNKLQQNHPHLSFLRDVFCLFPCPAVVNFNLKSPRPKILRHEPAAHLRIHHGIRPRLNAIIPVGRRHAVVRAPAARHELIIHPVVNLGHVLDRFVPVEEARNHVRAMVLQRLAPR
ncbi:hypothetical protein VTI74DRAFT_10619 [Chaetomium olivicolor]